MREVCGSNPASLVKLDFYVRDVSGHYSLSFTFVARALIVILSRLSFTFHLSVIIVKT